MASELLGAVVERRGDATRDPEGFGTVVAVEHGLAEKPAVVLISVTGTRSDPLPVRMPDFERDWTVLEVPAELPIFGPSSCLRCARVNFGPCISATCLDLQVRYGRMPGTMAGGNPADEEAQMSDQQEPQRDDDPASSDEPLREEDVTRDDGLDDRVSEEELPGEAS